MLSKIPLTTSAYKCVSSFRAPKYVYQEHTKYLSQNSIICHITCATMTSYDIYSSHYTKPPPTQGTVPALQLLCYSGCYLNFACCLRVTDSGSVSCGRELPRLITLCGKVKKSWKQFSVSIVPRAQEQSFSPLPIFCSMPSRLSGQNPSR